MKIQNTDTRPTISKARRIAFAALFTALALVLSIAENYIPVMLLIPVPGIKLGLANIVTVFAIVMLGPWDAVTIILVRCLVMGLFTGPVALMFSLAGAILSFVVMKLLSYGLDRTFSIIGVSMGGAVAHNIGQVLAAVFLMQDTGLIYSYLPLLMIVALFTGALTGLAALPLVTVIRKAVFSKTKAIPGEK